MKNTYINSDERATKFSLEIIKLIRRQKYIDFALKEIFRQLIRSATSIGANIYEAKGGSSRKDFTLFLSHSLKSSIETCYWLNLLKKGYDFEEIDHLIIECQQLSKILGKSVMTLRNDKKAS